jgi:hypothetical protein
VMKKDSHDLVKGYLVLAEKDRPRTRTRVRCVGRERNDR